MDSQRLGDDTLRPPRTACWSAIIAAVALFFGVGARADEIPTIHLSDAGPNSALPIGQSFYLTGNAPVGAKSVRPVFVRYSYAPWGIRRGSGVTNCTHVKAALQNLNQESIQPDAPFLTPGVFDISTAWVAPMDEVPRKDYHWLDTFHHAFTSGAWTRPEADADKESVQYKVLVPAHPFFRPDAKYCLLMYHQSLFAKGHQEIREGISRYVKDLDRCARDGMPSDPRAPVPKEEISKCYLSKRATFENLYKKFTYNFPAEAQDKIEKLINKLTSARATGLRREEIEYLQELLRLWSHVAAPVQVDRYLELWNKKGDPGDALADAVIGLLADGYKVVVPAMEPIAGTDKKRIRFYTPDGKLQIRYLFLPSDLSTLVIADVDNPTTPQHRQVLGVKAGEMLLPDSKLTLRDLLEFINGRVRFNDTEGYVELPRARVMLKTIELARRYSLPDPAELQELEVAVDKLAQLEGFIRRALRSFHDMQKEGHAPNVDMTPKTIMQSLGRWLSTQLASCAGPECGAVDETELDPQFWPWPNYRSIADSPLNRLIDTLRQFINATNAWNKELKKLELALTVPSVKSMAPMFEIIIETTQKSWIFSYVTLSTGFSVIINTPHPFWVHQVGLQLFFWPNNIDDPMWRNGIYDLRRFFFLEAGVATTAGPFGPENRYAGPPGINFESTVPPLFFGAGLQILPYPSVSTGVAVLGRRSSTLLQEEVARMASPYVGISIQLNLPDAIKAISKSRNYQSTGAQ
jgi:hypothetical protein